MIKLRKDVNLSCRTSAFINIQHQYEAVLILNIEYFAMPPYNYKARTVRLMALAQIVENRPSGGVRRLVYQPPQYYII